jgi:3-oxosteroid 1-dehydrogenase
MQNVPERWDLQADLVAVGSSSGGLVGAVVGHDLGLSTVVIEKADTIGGGNALSAGLIWIPDNHHMAEQGLSDSREEALTYIRRIAMGRHDEEKAIAFLDNGLEMLRYIEEHTPLKMIVVPGFPDYRVELPGAKATGRTLVPDPVGMAVVLAEAQQRQPLLTKVRRSPVPAIFGVPDGFFLAGQTLVGPLVMACIDRGIDILINTRARQLIVNEGRVVGLRAERNGRDFLVKSNCAVLLATGGYEWNEQMNKRFIHGPPVYACTNPQNEGDGHIMGMEVGAAVALMDHTMWMPIIHVAGEEIDGKPFYRFFLRSYRLPGDMLVNRHGKRCCNESFYPDAGRAFIAYDSVKSEYANLPMFWIADQSHRNKYYCGPLAPGESAERADWLHRADTVRELAERLGLPPDNLEETVQRFNRFAREGKDPDFHRGETAFDRSAGDPNHEPNPCLGPLEEPPFYGLQVHPGTVGHQGGLVTNPNAQVIHVNGSVIPGLYATSNTAAYTDIGFSYQSGFANGRSMVWGYVAARHVAESAK